MLQISTQNQRFKSKYKQLEFSFNSSNQRNSRIKMDRFKKYT